jgi:TonB family protein
MLALCLVVVVLGLAAPDSPGAAQSAAQQSSATAEQPAQPWPPIGVSRPGGGVTSPVIIKEMKPQYTSAAMRAKIQGNVEVEAVVQTDGQVGEVRVVRSLDTEYGLDEAAVKAVKNWTFNPGKKDGIAVPVLVKIELTFRLRK